MAVLEIEVSNTKESAKEAEVLTRRPHYWLRTMFTAGYHLYLLIPGIYIGWLGVRGLVYYVSSPAHNWLYALLCAGLATIPLILAAVIRRDVLRRAKAEKSGQLKFTFSDGGISGIDTAGFRFDDMWSSYAGFYVGRGVIVCPKAASPLYLRIPIADISADQRQAICLILSQHLPEIKRESLSSLGTRG